MIITFGTNEKRDMVIMIIVLQNVRMTMTIMIAYIVYEDDDGNGCDDFGVANCYTRADTFMTDSDHDDGCLVCFSDLEEDCPRPKTIEKLVAERLAFVAALPGLDRLERLSMASSMREMAAQVR